MFGLQKGRKNGMQADWRRSEEEAGLSVLFGKLLIDEKEEECGGVIDC